MHGKTNVVSTSFANRHFKGGLDFIDLILNHSPDVVDKILVWNFDMSNAEVRWIKNIQRKNKQYKEKVQIVDFPLETHHFYPEYFGIPKQFAWVPAVWWFSRNYGDNILWMDSNKPPITSLDTVFAKIEDEEIFAGSGFGPREFIKNWAHDTCKKKMGVTEELGDKRVIHAGTLGYKKNGKYNDLFMEAYNWSKQREVIQGRKDIHARDQIVISILIAKTNYKLYQLTSQRTDGKVIRTYWEGKPHNSDVILEIYRL